MIILAGRDQFAERVVHFVAENAAEYIGREYFGAIGAIVVPLAAYFALKRFEIKRQSDAIEPEENKDILKELGNQLERGVLIVSLRAAICGLIGFGAALTWVSLAGDSSDIRVLGSDRSAQTVWLAVSASTLLWFYRYSWRNPAVGFCAAIAGVLLLKFGWLELAPVVGCAWAACCYHSPNLRLQNTLENCNRCILSCCCRILFAGSGGSDWPYRLPSFVWRRSSNDTSITRRDCPDVIRSGGTDFRCMRCAGALPSYHLPAR